MRLPSRNQWFQIFKVLTKKEKMAFLVFSGLFLSSAVSLSAIFYFKNTEIQPAVGGKYIEGIVGSPRFINPIYAANNDVDRDLVELIFSGIMKYAHDGRIVPDLAEEIEIKEEGEIYEVYLKKNLSWHDGSALTAEDVIFTFKTIQNPDYNSPLRGNYIGIETEKINDLAVRFKLKNSYAGFLERLTLKIIPKHIWQDISPQNFLLTNHNLQPVGSGPYKLKNLKQNVSGSIVSLDLVRFKKPYLSELRFKFFKTNEDLIKAARRKDIDGFAGLSGINGFREITLSIPRYFAVFFNPDKSRFLAEEKIRKALNYGTDKTEIVENILLDKGRIVHSPILPEIYGYEKPNQIYQLDLEKTESLLEDAGLEKKDGKWIKSVKEEIAEFKSDLKVGSRGKEVKSLQTCLEGRVTGYFGAETKKLVIQFQEEYAKDILEPWGFKTGTGLVSKTTRAKLNEICLEPPEETFLKFTLITVQDPILMEVAEALKNQWQNLDIEIEILAYPISQLKQETIKPRNYEMLLFGEVLQIIPDPYPFWHSSQIKDPGLNLAKYDNQTADRLLEKARITLNEEIHAENLEKFQDILIADAPAVFLYSPEYLYFISPKIKGLDSSFIADPSKRFSNIEEWYIKTRRVWK